MMPKSLLEVLKTGLAELKKRVKARKDDLLARLGKKEKLTNEEAEWLDHTANFVDEKAIVSLLEKAFFFFFSHLTSLQGGPYVDGTA